MDYKQFLIEQFTFVQDNLPQGIQIYTCHKDDTYGDMYIVGYTLDYSEGNKDELTELLDEFRGNEFLPHFKDKIMMVISQFITNKAIDVTFIYKDKYDQLINKYGTFSDLKFSHKGPLGEIYKDRVVGVGKDGYDYNYEISILEYDKCPRSYGNDSLFQFWCETYGIEYEFWNVIYLNVFIANLRRDPSIAQDF